MMHLKLGNKNGKVAKKVRKAWYLVPVLLGILAQSTSCASSTSAKTSQAPSLNSTTIEERQLASPNNQEIADVNCQTDSLSNIKLQPENSDGAKLYGNFRKLPIFSIKTTRANLLKSVMRHAERCRGIVESSIVRYISELPKEPTFDDFHGAYSIREWKCSDFAKPLDANNMNFGGSGYLLAGHPICLGGKYSRVSIIQIRSASWYFIDWSLTSDPGRRREAAAVQQERQVIAPEFLRVLLSNGFETLPIARYPDLTSASSHPGPTTDPMNHYSICSPQKDVCFYLRFVDIFDNIENVLSKSDEDFSEEVGQADFPKYHIADFVIYLAE